MLAANLYGAEGMWMPQQIPQLSDEGRIRLRAFELMDGQRSLEAIARQLASEFPKRFARWQDALTYTGRISREYSL